LRRRGLKSADRVLIAAPNSVGLIHAWLGTIWAGGMPAAVNPDLTQSEIEYLVDDLQPRITLRQYDLDAIDVASSHPATGPTMVEPLSPAAIVYTSGTTSRPKGVLVRHASYTETGRSFPGWIGIRGQQRLWACLPLFHINAQAYSLMTGLVHGFPVALTAKFHASTFWKDARQLEVTSVNVVGAMLEMLAAQAPDTWVESQLRTIYAAPGPAPQQRDQLERRFRNPVMSPGYWNAPEITQAALRGGWLHTGDAGFRDEDGDVFLTGRYKEMIRRRGENIAPAEVEDALCANPAVKAAAVFGVSA